MRLPIRNETVIERHDWPVILCLNAEHKSKKLLKRNKYYITQTPQLSNTLGLKEDLKAYAHMGHIKYKITFCLLVNLKESCIIPLTKRTHPNYLR